MKIEIAQATYVPVEDKSTGEENAKSDGAAKPESVIQEEGLSKFEYDAKMDLEMEILNELNSQPTEQEKLSEDSDKERDPFCGL